MRVTGTEGELRLFNPTGPQFGYRMTVRRGGTSERVRVEGARTPTYSYQLRAFADAIRGADTVLTPPTDSVATMTVIDAVYRAAGLAPRVPSNPAA